MPRKLTIIRSLMACVLAFGAVPGKAQSPDDADTRAAYRAALDELFRSPEAPEVILLADSVLRFTGDRSWLSVQTVEDFTSPPMKAPFPSDLPYRIRLKLLGSTEIDSLAQIGRRAMERRIATGKPAGLPFWPALAEKYPNAWGLTAFSEIVFNPSHDRALIWVRHGCGGCFHEETMQLTKEGSRWTVFDRLVTENGSRDGIGPGNMRYLWLDARMRVDSLIAEHTRLMHEADSLRDERRPRRLRGVIVNHLTRQPISAASVFLQVAPDTTLRQLALDSQGRFEVDDHPTGGGLVLVQCAGFPAQHPNPIAAVSLGSRAAQDTTVVIEAGPISPCWHARRARPIVAGELASSAYRTSPFPNDVESPVYRAIVRELRRSEPGSSILLRSFSATPCLHADWKCGTPEVSLLVAEGLIDSTAVAAIERPSVSPRPFRTEFGREQGLSFLTPGEEAYLTAEMLSIDNDVRYRGDSADQFVRTALQAHSRARHITSFGPVAFDSANQRALVQVRREQPEKRKMVETMLLSREPSGWKVARRHIEKEPLSARYRGTACTPARAETVPSDAALGTLKGLYSLELVSATGTRPMVSEMHVRFRPMVSDSLGRAQAPEFSIFEPATGARDHGTESAVFIESGNRKFARASRAMRLHGEGYVLEVRDAGDGQIFGSWRYYFGLFVDETEPRVPEPAGYFCARSIQERPAYPEFTIQTPL